MSDPHVCTTSGIMFNLAEPTPEMASIAFLSRFHSSYREAFEKDWRGD